MSLKFTNIIFDEAVEKMEPEKFQPDVKEYVIYPKLGSGSITFWVTMNQDPNPPPGCSSYVAFENYSTYYEKNLEIYRYMWEASSQDNPRQHPNCIPVEDRGSRIELKCDAHHPDLESLSIVFVVKTPIGQCPHDNTRSEEGDIFGGACGSCQIETIIYCNDCGKLVEKQYEYCD